MEINKKLLQSCYADFKKKKPLFEKMYEYFKGNTDAQKNYQFQTDRANNVIGMNYVKKFVLEEVSFSLGVPLQITSKSNNDQIIKDIEFYTCLWSASHNTNLDKQMLIYSQAYELYYINEVTGEFMAKIIPPTSGYAYADDYGELQFFMYIFKKNFDTKVYIDLYTDTELLHLDANFKEVAPSKPHYFGRVPIAIAQLSEEQTDNTIYKEIKMLQDALETNTSDSSNELTDTRSSYIVIKGTKLEDKDVPELKKKGVIQITSKDGDAKYMLKNLNDSFIQNTLNNLEDKMYQLTDHINQNEKTSSNVSGIALRSKIIGLSSKAKLNQQALEDTIKTRIEMLFIYLKKLTGKEYDVRDITVKFTSNLPQDDLILSQIINNLGDKLSLDTGLSQLSFIDSSLIERQKIKAEQEETSIGMGLLTDAETKGAIDVKPMVEPVKTIGGEE
ncbi:phage portal protein [Clostridium lacusfryxellense]|uniref:phage portal protein n=1 Tax=Clostridium lacusfryxellense TaxID=205328 RepID=UPI001C0C727E|nr:phage portal protein [Clostridium lacusfryxellense]MBU3112127.1 phage portal protein [Clostridium lacusfryxellense]